MMAPLKNETLGNVPPEVFQQLLDFCNWGDLAKLACVRKEWSNLIAETTVSSDLEWQLALSYKDGTNGLAQQPEKAVEIFHKLSGIDIEEEADGKDGFAPAMKELARHFFLNQLAPKGLQWLKAAHTRGSDLDAAYEVALVYEYGQHGLPRDVVEAAVWLEKGANQGHVECMTELALCYELGCGVPQDDEKALDWYYKAAEKGNLTAKYSVGEAFEEARGVPQSDEEACLWYYKAAVEGDEDSRRALRRLRDIARIVVPGVGLLLDD